MKFYNIRLVISCARYSTWNFFKLFKISLFNGWCPHFSNSGKELSEKHKVNSRLIYMQSRSERRITIVVDVAKYLVWGKTFSTRNELEDKLRILSILRKDASLISNFPYARTWTENLRDPDTYTLEYCMTIKNIC